MDAVRSDTAAIRIPLCPCLLAIPGLDQGLDFHRFYFALGEPEGAHHTTIVDPRVLMLGESAALVTCIRLVQAQTPSGPVTRRAEETRVW